jgi:hypothetical protein
LLSSKKKKLKESIINLKMLADRLSGKKVAILDIEELSFIPHFLPVYRALQKKTDKISYYIATHYTGDKSFNEFGIKESRRFPVTMSRNLINANVFISAHIYGVGNRETYKIHINHNQPVKYQSYQKRDFVNFDSHFLTSPLHREQTEDTIRNYGLENMKIDLFDIGYAKSDSLLNGEYSREKVLNDLGLSPLNKTVLYSPSWDEGLSLRTNGKKIIEKLLETNEINVIVKLHPISYCPPDGPNYKFYTGGIDWITEFSVFESNKNFRHVPVSNIDPILSAADVMVTDVSSVALEFIMLDKPVIYIDCPEFFEKTLSEVYSGFGETTAEFVKNDPKANAGRHTGIVVEKIDELSEAVNRCLNNPDELSYKRSELSKKLSYNPGHAGDVAADTIIKILKI